MKFKVKAKLNLILRIKDKRADGYHNLEMINARINLCDVVTVKKTTQSDKLIYIKHPEYNTSSDNLILKTLKTLKDKYNIKSNYLIKVKKQIPFGAGLGGASMDAGEIARYICKREKINISVAELIELLKPLGADIPYSLYDLPCVVEGTGDKITPIIVPKKELILISPNIYIDTKTVFQTYDKHNNFTQTKSETNIIDDLNNNNYYNELQEATYICEPKLKNLADKLMAYGKVVMSGSGSSLFLDTRLNKKKVVSKLKKDYPLYIIKIIKVPK